MTTYELLLFLHIAAAIVWIGTGVGLLLLGRRFDVSGDTAALGGLFGQVEWLSNRVFIPVSLVVLALGVALTIDGPWSFGDLWIVLGLVGYVATFVTGVAVLKPLGERIGATIQRDGGMSAEATALMRRMFVLMRIDYAVLFMVVAVMALKPTADDVAALALMAAVIVATAAWVVRDLRTDGATESVREPA